jgi:hypothetical protein
VKVYLKIGRDQKSGEERGGLASSTLADMLKVVHELQDIS